MFKRNWLLGISLVFCITGCGLFKDQQNYLRDHSQDYHDATLVAPLIYPDNVPSLASSNQYPLPTEIPDTVSEMSVIPPVLNELIEPEKESGRE
jgi:uncharacterized lipoprotein